MSRLDHLFAFLLECRIYNWLRGTGFVDHDTVRAYLAPGEFEESQTDTSARARMFMAGVSQSRVPPVWGLGIEVSLPYFR